MKLLTILLSFQLFACPFCNQEVLDTQVFYTGETTLALINYRPTVPGHVMIIPKRHVERFEQLTSEEIADIGDTIKKVDIAIKKIHGNTGYILFQKNGKESGQTVPHLHFHYLPRTEGDSHIWFTFRFFISPWETPMSLEQQHEAVAKCKAAIHNPKNDAFSGTPVVECKAAIHNPKNDAFSGTPVVECKAAIHNPKNDAFSGTPVIECKAALHD